MSKNVSNKDLLDKIDKLENQIAFLNKTVQTMASAQNKSKQPVDLAEKRQRIKDRRAKLAARFTNSKVKQSNLEVKKGEHVHQIRQSRVDRHKKKENAVVSFMKKSGKAAKEAFNKAMNFSKNASIRLANNVAVEKAAGIGAAAYVGAKPAVDASVKAAKATKSIAGKTFRATGRASKRTYKGVKNIYNINKEKAQTYQAAGKLDKGTYYVAHFAGMLAGTASNKAKQQSIKMAIKANKFSESQIEKVANSKLGKHFSKMNQAQKITSAKIASKRKEAAANMSPKKAAKGL